jgi:hypothetical protein
LLSSLSDEKSTRSWLDSSGAILVGDLVATFVSDVSMSHMS